jgi:V/A-type H+-transporting ATPase subunit I
MLRPERMSRVSVTGSKAVMDEAVETVHRMDLFHVTDYDGAWEGFDPGNPVEGADEASELLVTVRSLESILDVDESDAGPMRVLDPGEIDDELEDVRQRVNELDDRYDELQDRHRELDDRIEAVAPFADLGIDLDLLGGYDSIAVAVGEADEEPVRRALMEAGSVDEFESFAAPEAGIVAVFANTDRDDLEDALVGVEFAAVEVPDGDGDPGEYVEDLRQQRREVASKLDTVENELEDLRHEVGDFLLAAEEALTIAVQRREAPLSFATTESAFVAEGWIPSERYLDFAEGLYEAVGDHVDVDELERATYDGEGQLVDREEIGPGAPGPEPTAADGGADVRTDGGHASAGGTMPMSDSEPPVVQDNPGPVRPFETLVKVLNRPKYSELDPTIVLFLTFPAFFGFMIGDLGYGLLYLGIGYWITQRFESDAIRSLGVIGMFSGVFTMIFGVLYGEFFGLHQLGEILWAGHPPIHKGLQPHYVEYALAWIVVALIAGILHLLVGYAFEFYEQLEHGFVDALFETGSWIIMLLAAWTWVFSTSGQSVKPTFLVGAESVFNGHPFALGFTGLAPLTIPGVGVPVHLPVFLLGLAMLVYAEPVDSAFGIESLNVLVNILSYARIPAVLLAKAGMALAVNLLVFGAYNEEGEIHLVFFNQGHFPEVPAEDVIFTGLVNADSAVALAAGLVFAAVIFVFGHLLVLALGITSAGLQAVRLEYVEFMQKFYEGGGEPYDPFGRERRYTAEE